MTQFNPSEYRQFDHFIVSEIEPGFIHIQINRPSNLNAFSEKTWRQYYHIFSKLNKSERVNVIFLSSSNDRAFSVGLDLKETVANMRSLVTATPSQLINNQMEMYTHIKKFQNCIGVPSKISIPTIVLNNGFSYGLGIDIIAACTIRVATSDSRFSIKEIDIGIPADIGSLQRLPGIVNNQSLLNEYALTGREFSSKEALELGLISRIVDTKAEGLIKCIEMGKVINSKQQWAVRGTKDSLQFMNDGGSVNQGLENIALYNSENIDERFVKTIMRVFKM